MNRILMIVILFCACSNDYHEIEHLSDSVSPSFEKIIGEWRIEKVLSESRWKRYEDFVVYQFLNDSSGAKYIKVGGLQKKVNEFNFYVDSDSLIMLVFNRTKTAFSDTLKFACRLSDDENILELVSHVWAGQLQFFNHESFEKTFDNFY